MTTRIIIASFIALALSMAAFGQTTNDVPNDVTIFVGPSVTTSDSTPQIGGSVGAMYNFSATTGGGLVADLGFRKSGNPQTNLRAILAQRVAAVNKFPIYLLADIGGAFASSDPSALVTQAGKLATALIQNVGTNIGYTAATGIGSDIPIFAGIHMLPYARIVKGSLNNAYMSFGVNFGKKVSVSRN